MQKLLDKAKQMCVQFDHKSNSQINFQITNNPVAEMETVIQNIPT